MFQQTNRPQKPFVSLFTQHVVQSKLLSDMTLNVFIRYFKNFTYNPVNYAQVHNTTQNSPENISTCYPPDNHHCSDTSTKGKAGASCEFTKLTE